MLSRRAFIAGGLAVLGCGTLGYATLAEPFWFEIKEVTLHLPGASPSLKGLRIVQLSDLHVCYRISESYLKRAFRAVSALKPDLLVYTGDFITAEPDTFKRLSRLEEFFPQARLGAFGVLGNHDYGPGWADTECAAEVIRFATRSGIRILRNETARVQELQIVGMDDLWAGRFEPSKALVGVDGEQPSLALCHNPDGVDLSGWGRFRGWILAGHTHGGQCRPPFLPPPLLPVKNRRYTAGEFGLGSGRTLYINRGLGYLYQVRFNARPEVTVFTIA